MRINPAVLFAATATVTTVSANPVPTPTSKSEADCFRDLIATATHKLPGPFALQNNWFGGGWKPRPENYKRPEARAHHPHHHPSASRTHHKPSSTPSHHHHHRPHLEVLE